MSKTVGKAVLALDSLAEGPRTISELARDLGVHSSTVFRMLQPLVDGQLIARSADGRYRLGLRLAELGQRVLEDIDLRSVARKHLVRLADSTGATVHLSQLVDDRIVYIDKIESSSSIRTWSRIGRAVPLHTAAVSKVILASLAREHRERLLAQHEFTRYTENTITSEDAFRSHLEEVARLGYATDQAEFESLVHCLGVGVPGASGRVEAALSLTTVRTTPDAAELRRLVTQARQTAKSIATELGHGPR